MRRSNLPKASASVLRGPNKWLKYSVVPPTVEVVTEPLAHLTDVAQESLQHTSPSGEGNRRPSHYELLRTHETVQAGAESVCWITVRGDLLHQQE